MEIIKYKNNQVLAHLKHDLREYPKDKNPSNKSIDCELSSRNYSLLKRGDSAKEINRYRKEFESKLYKYNRKDLVHAIELVIQAPNDCDEIQKEDFFRESFEWLCSTLPAGKDCVLLAEVHKDEKHYTSDGIMISKDHLHIMYMPAVRDTKHEGYEYKLCADALTKKSQLKKMHPALQDHLDIKGICCTVHKKKKNDGKTIGLSVKHLKEITAKTGVFLDKSITIDNLCEMIAENRDLKNLLHKEIESNKVLKQRVEELDSLHNKALKILEEVKHEKELLLAENERLKTKDKEWEYQW